MSRIKNPKAVNLCEKYGEPHEPDTTGWCGVCDTRPAELLPCQGTTCVHPCGIGPCRWYSGDE